MPTEAEKRAAVLAVSRFGADRGRVQSLYQGVMQARARGEPADLFEALVAQKLLSPEQARELYLALDATRVDPSQPLRPPGQGAASPPGPANGDQVSLDPFQDLRSLGQYRILRRLGEGGMGSVYLGYLEGQGQQVAVKVLADHLASNQGFVDRFYREARSGALLNHPNIVRGYSVGQDRATGKHYLVLEYVDGPSALALLARDGRLAVADAVHVALDIARALEHAHSRNIVHRDIKPDNILITRSGVAKLADLGLAKRTDEASHLTAARQGFGTPYYMPYEQAINARHADARSDIYALGATLYHLVTGEVPFAGENHLEVVEKKERGEFTPARLLNPEVPASLDRILARMMARVPRERYQTASELIIDLERTGLAAAMPSFADAELALRDPAVRNRLAAVAQPTVPSLDPGETPTPPAAPADAWLVRYRSEEGRWCKARLTTQQIARRVREGRLTGAAEARRRPQDRFRPLAEDPVLRDLFPAAGEPGVGRTHPAKRPAGEPKPAAGGGSAEAAAWSRCRWLVVLGVTGGLTAVAAGVALACKLLGGT